MRRGKLDALRIERVEEVLEAQGDQLRRIAAQLGSRAK